MSITYARIWLTADRSAAPPRLHCLFIPREARHLLFFATKSQSSEPHRGRGTIRPVASIEENPNLKERLVSAAPVEGDSSFELKLRPKRLAEFRSEEHTSELQSHLN